MKMAEWRLVTRTGHAPVVEIWIYERQGLRFQVTYLYVYNANGKVHQFGDIAVVINNKKHII